MGAFSMWKTLKRCHTFTFCVITIGQLIKCKHRVDHTVFGNLKMSEKDIMVTFTDALR